MQYVPPQSTWTPTESTWTPSPSTYTLPSNDDGTWSPSTWTPQDDSTTVDGTDNGQRRPMETLIEMGFANRQLNADLLRRFDNNIDRVVQELILCGESDWPATRH